MNINTLVRMASVAAFASLFTTPVFAAVVAPGASAFLPGTSLSATPALNGSVVYTNSLAYDLDPSIALFVGHGEVTNQAIRSNLADSLIFALQLLGPINITADDVLIDSIILNGYAGWQTDIHYRSDTAGDRGPSFVERSANGDNLQFTFGFPLFLGNLTQEAHEESFPIEILTNADAFETSGRATIRGRTVVGNTPLQVSIGGLAVPTVVPLPASCWLFLAGIGVLLGLTRTQQKT
ncbi:MAG: hypothetical protein M0R33_07010 [Methylomonas sp.]|jgi:hypothetical protein|uniref:hypothetical protein n=1 Tax=Methylomonas sp. TaxID=418 RepID=UPI0025CDD97D|nr:hypothetical protein [Methylomonas sp.]MCK9606189.1 hypothetical protein [Methylomonas sp.]